MKRLNPRRVKVHRSYTVEEVARLFGVHKTTVRGWLKAGLPRIDGRRPILILGRELAGFLHARRDRRRQRCRSGELYCFRCRAPRRCALRTAGDLQVALPQAQQRITESAEPSLNCHLERVPDA